MGEGGIGTVNMLTLAFGTVFIPPVQAVLVPFIEVNIGAVALICAGLFMTNGNRRQNTFKISLGFLLGDLWALTAVQIMEIPPQDPNVELYLTLFILGEIAVIIGETLTKVIYTPAQPCGWAIDLTIMGPMRVDQIDTLPVQIGIVMLMGVIYVGVGVDALQKVIMKRLTR